MAQNFDANSTQASVLVNFDNAIAAGAVVTVQDEDGNEILRVTGTKQAQCMVISSPDLAVGKTYTILADGEQVTTFEAAMSTETGSGFGGFGGFGGGMQKPGSDGTEPPEASGWRGDAGTSGRPAAPGKAGRSVRRCTAGERKHGSNVINKREGAGDSPAPSLLR